MNVEALLMNGIGIRLEELYRQCGDKLSPFTDCVAVEGVSLSSCGSCYYGKGRGHCEF